MLSEEEVERIQKTDLEVYNTGNPYFGMERIILKDGRSYDTIVRKSIIEDDGKRFLLNTRWDQSLQNELKRRAQLLTVTMEDYLIYYRRTAPFSAPPYYSFGYQHISIPSY